MIIMSAITYFVICIKKGKTSEGCPILSTRLHSYPLAFNWKTGSVVVKSPIRVGDPLDTNRFYCKSIFSIRERLRKFSLILYGGGGRGGGGGLKVVPMEPIVSIGHG